MPLDASLCDTLTTSIPLESSLKVAQNLGELIDSSIQMLVEKESGAPHAQRYNIRPESIVNCCLRWALTNCRERESGIAFLREKDCSSLLSRCADGYATSFAKFVADPSRNLYPPANDTTKELVHAAWLLGDFEVSDRLLCPLPHGPELTKRHFSTRFWFNYHLSLVGFATRTPYNAEEFKRRGHEHYWFNFIRLFKAVATGAPHEPVISEIEDAFEKVNRDKRLTDWLGVDGDGQQPVAWNFRLESVRNAAEHWYDLKM